ncbi:MAG: hypothetical protein FJX04_08460 [Alphaproteobacteria bacterium]|nr:hypothetical protein [Alphaproteobacteria bacterium]
MIVFSPLFSSPLFEFSLATLFVAAAFTLYQRRERGVMRAFFALVFALVIANPTITIKETKKLKSSVTLLIDRSGSQTLSDRSWQTDKIVEDVKKKINALGSFETRVIDITDRNDEGTRAFSPLRDALADVPPEQIGGAIFITDGVVDDVPKDIKSLGFTAPMHALISGHARERDRRVELVEAPPFGIVNRDITLRVKVSDQGFNDPVPVTINQDGKQIATIRAKPGDPVSIPVLMKHAGPSVIEIKAEATKDELTPINNLVVTTIKGIRDRMTVLLVSGIPHQGERTWRNILKSDANVDLVHFTILRPPEKQDGTPVNELALIPFPTKELFETKINEFDLIILDRFADMALLPPTYFANMVRYVRKGGAILIAAGPEFAGTESPAETPLRDLLPAFPTGNIIESEFLPRLTSDGQKHPVTRDLKGGASDPPQWGEWLRQIETGNISGTSVMSGAQNQPLLILRRDGEGRVALLLSDHVWLWARQFRGGGPHLDLLRHVAHWLMKEPALEEEALRTRSDKGRIKIERQSMNEVIVPLTLISPSGKDQSITLSSTSPGVWMATIIADETGLYKVTDGTLTAFASAGPSNPREFQEVLSTRDRLLTLFESTGGSVKRVAETPGEFKVPNIIARDNTPRFAGDDFIALKDTKSETLLTLSLYPLLQGPWGLLALGFMLIILWISEAGGWRRLFR